MMKRYLLAAALAVSSAGSGAAQGVVTQRHLALNTATEIAMAAVEQCRKDGFRVAVAIVDRAGNVVVLVRDNGAGPQTEDSARRKAFTSAAFGIPTAEFVNRVSNPAGAGLKDLAGTVALAGGLPIRAGSDLLAGIGVGGAPGGDKDEACAKVGIDKVAAQLK